MRRIELKRFYRDKDRCLGVWTMDELEWPLFTLEPSWKENKKDESCIPEGVYSLEPYYSPENGGCFEIKDVPERTLIRVHIANWVRDTDGCICIGKVIDVGREGGMTKKELGVFDSQNAMKELLEIIKEPSELYISNGW